MKKIIHTIIIALTLFSFTITSCSDMNSVHQEFLDRGMGIYIGIPVDVTIGSGIERVRVDWVNNADPRVTRTIVFWNNRADSVIVPIDRTTPIREKIIPLSPGSYIFEVLNETATGARSLPIRMAAESFNSELGAALDNRTVSAIFVGDTPSHALLRFNVVYGVYSTHINYVNRYGAPVSMELSGAETTLVVYDFPIGGEFTHYSLYLLTGSIDKLPTRETTARFPIESFTYNQAAWNLVSANYTRLNRADWELVFISSQQNLTGPWAAENVIMDNNLGWHSPFSAPFPPLPHVLEIDIQQVLPIGAIQIAHREAVRNANLYLSKDGTTWIPAGTLGWPQGGASGFPGVSQFSRIAGTFDARFIRFEVTQSWRAHDSAVNIWDIFLWVP